MATTPAPPEPGRRGAAMAHVGMLVGPVLLALVLARTDGRADPFVRAHAEEAVGFQVPALLALVVAALLVPVTIGWLLLPAVAALATIQSVLAARAALQGRAYRYPVSLPRPRRR